MQDNPCEVCSAWSTLLWSKALSAIAKPESKRSNSSRVQQVDSSMDSSLPLPEGNEGHVVGNHSVVGVEVSSSQALTTGSNLGAHHYESSTFGNGTGNSSQPSCPRALTLVQAPLGQDPPDHHRRIRPLDTTTGYMVPAISRDGPFAPGQGFRDLTVRVQGAALIVLPRVVDLFLDLVLALSVAMARVIGVVIASARNGTVALILNVATVLTEAIDPARFLLGTVAKHFGQWTAPGSF